jgi:molecular chaperone DnaK
MQHKEVEFNIDANGILNVSATDKATGKTQRIQIQGSSGLSKDEVERMKKDAESHASEDKARRELIDLKNQGEQIVYATRKRLEQHGDKVGADIRSSIESAISNVEDKLKGDDKKALEAALKQLNDASIELGKVVYEASKAAGATSGEGESASGGGGGKKPADDVIDAEYEVKDEK